MPLRRLEGVLPLLLEGVLPLRRGRRASVGCTRGSCRPSGLRLSSLPSRIGSVTTLDHTEFTMQVLYSLCRYFIHYTFTMQVLHSLCRFYIHYAGKGECWMHAWKLSSICTSPLFASFTDRFRDDPGRRGIHYQVFAMHELCVHEFTMQVFTMQGFIMQVFIMQVFSMLRFFDEPPTVSRVKEIPLQICQLML